ncbi:MAG TPA: 3-oxoacyl-ACP reductase [Solibacterales bacterium]|nr:3-oxoacyl-ACP reductase [Bryobacterales bacterium]
MVEEFARQGARVAFLDIDRESSERLVADLAGQFPFAPVFEPADVRDVAALRDCLRRIEGRLGPVRVLINNAADDHRHRYEDVTPEYWDNCMAVNLRPHFFAIQAVAPGMAAAGGGSIVNLSSIAWIIPSTGQPGYVTAKAAVVGLTRTMARELAPARIRVNAVLPGAIATERQRRLWYTPEYKAKIQAAQAWPRELTPGDVTRTALFLAAGDSEAITGQSVVVDGGWV